MARVVVVATTWYKDPSELRYQLALKMVRAAREIGRDVILVDNSPEPMRDMLRVSGATVFPQLEKGMGPGRRQVFFHGAEKCKRDGLTGIFYTEPEKYDLMRYIPDVEKAFDAGADLVIPWRTEKSWATYPDFQVQSEKRGHEQTAAINHRPDLDCWFGPVAYHKDVAGIVITVDPLSFGGVDTYIPQFMVTAACLVGLNVVSVPVDFDYSEQKAQEDGELSEEMKAKRLSQLETVVRAHRTLAMAL